MRTIALQSSRYFQALWSPRLKASGWGVCVGGGGGGGLITWVCFSRFSKPERHRNHFPASSASSVFTHCAYSSIFSETERPAVTKLHVNVCVFGWVGEGGFSVYNDIWRYIPSTPSSVARELKPCREYFPPFETRSPGSSVG